MALRVAVGNNKGGTEKTTTVVRLAEALGKAGKRVGVVDFDPQGNASRRLGWKDGTDQGTAKYTVAEAIAYQEDPETRQKVVYEGQAATIWQPIGWTAPFAERIRLLPSRYNLEDRNTEAAQKGAWRRLTKALKGTDDDLDYVLIDCPPSLGHLTQMALAASDYALASTDVEFDSVEAAVRYRDFVAASAEDLGKEEIPFIGLIVSRYDGRVGGHKGQLEGARQIFGDKLWGVVPQRATILNADEYAVPLDQVRDSHEPRAVYELLAERFIKEVGA
ncbi:ParA family protein [Streptomyces sp. NPDC059904]|uniref:ParA family protein n=1 Tax=Streptomyces sp. NPDC059904 TaxID=3346996 RepID=UPI00365EFD77